MRRLCLIALVLTASAHAAEPLTVCMADDSAPLSYTAQGTPRGFDVRIAQAIAEQLQRSLKVVLFESKYEQESTLAQEVNALLSSGVCELASGFSLMAADLGPPGRPTARVPDHPGAARRPLRPWVPLGALAASHPYHAMAMGVVVSDPQLKVDAQADLRSQPNLKVGAATGTLAGTALAMARNGPLRTQLVSLSRGDDPLAAIEAGRLDATLLPLGRFDAWRIVHPASPLRVTAYRHPLRINFGFVARADNPAVLDAANSVIDRALAAGDLPRWAADSGTTWVAPVRPALAPPFRIGDLVAD